jgi:hypothetical protein
MKFHRSRIAAAAAVLTLLMASPVRPARAQDAPTASPSAEQIARLKKLRDLKIGYNRLEAREKFEHARAYAYKKKHGKWPKGYKLERDREGMVSDDPAQVMRARAARAARGESETPVITTFPPNVRSNDPSSDAFPDAGQAEQSIAAIGNNILMAWNDGNGFDLNTSPTWQLQSYGYSTNGGASWTDGGTIPRLTVSPGAADWQWTSDPVVTVRESTGEFWYAGLVSPDGPEPSLTFPTGAGSHNGVAVVKGTFSGSTFTWGTPVLAFQGLNTQVSYDKEWITVDPANGNLYLTYTNFFSAGAGGDQIEFRRSTNGGLNWSAATVLSSATDNGNFAVQGSRVVVGPSGEVYVVWQAIGDSAADYFKIRKSTNGGLSFGGEVKAARYFSNFGTGAPGFNRGRGITYPSIAVDRTSGPNHGRVYLAWNESLNWYNDILPQGGGISEPEGATSSGADDAPAAAVSFTIGTRVSGNIGTPTDLDYFKFNAVQGTTYTFYGDAVAGGLELATRIICSDGATRLALSNAPSPGGGTIMTWTAPTSGTYYLRAQQGIDGGTGSYSIATYIHTTSSGDDRARDSRDVFVNSSLDGITWGQATRVNDDAPYLDDWLPELAIIGNSRVFCAYFDWRDAAAGSCGGQSNIYLFRSDNAGGTWSNLGRVSDVTSTWSTVSSNVAPNQGDYLSLYANNTGVYPAWGDGRDGNPNVYMVAIPIATPTQAALASSRVEAGQVQMTWLAADHAGELATLQRRSDSADWADLASRAVDSNGQVQFTDDSVSPGTTYTYRLAFAGSSSPYSAEATIVVPAGPALALRGARPNPAERELVVAFSLPSSEPATLSLLDVSGRAVRREQVGQLGAGTHQLDLTEGARIAPGVYLLELRQGQAVRTKRVSFVR